MDPKEVEARLAALDDNFKSASSEPMGYDNTLPEPGDYQTIFTRVEFFEKKDAPNNAFLKTVFEVQDDAMYQGKEIEMIYNLEPHKVPLGQPTPDRDAIEMKLGFLKRDLKTMGVDVDGEDFSFAQVRPGSAIWEECLNAPFLIGVRDSKKVNPNTGSPYRNAYLNERLGAPIPADIPVEPYAPAAVDANGDEIPF